MSDVISYVGMSVSDRCSCERQEGRSKGRRSVPKCIPQSKSVDGIKRRKVYGWIQVPLLGNLLLRLQNCSVGPPMY